MGSECNQTQSETVGLYGVKKRGRERSREVLCQGKKSNVQLPPILGRNAYPVSPGELNPRMNEKKTEPHGLGGKREVVVSEQGSELMAEQLPSHEEPK